MKKAIWVFFAAILCLAVLACDNDEYIGEYRTTDTINNMRFTYVLKLEKGGKCQSYSLPEGITEENLADEDIFYGTYKVKGNKITFYFKDIEGKDESNEGTILSNGNIKMFSLGAMRTYKKRK